MIPNNQPLRPTHIRYSVVTLAVALAAVTYLDRACIATLAPNIMRDLNLNKWHMSVVYSAFALAYAFFEIPTAWWADRIGTRRVLTRIVLWWSGFTMATAGVFNFASLMMTQFLFGAGAAGAWPSVARTFSRWIPREERGTIQGIFFCGAHLAGGLTPLIVLAVSQFVGWRVIFILIGLPGLLWVLVWHRWFRDDPSEHRGVNAAELEKIVTGRGSGNGHHAGWVYWKRVLGHRNTLPLCLMYFSNTYAFYFCITWLPTYLKETHYFTITSLGIFAGLPLMLSVLGDLFGGVTTDAVTARFGLRIGRSGVGAAAYVLAGGAMIFAAFTHQPVLAAILISLALAASMFTLGASWSTCQDIGGNHAGVVSAVMNTSGQIGSVLSPLVVTSLLQWFGSWNAPLVVMGGLFLMGAVAWLCVDPRKQIFD